MRALMLDLESLVVESFATDAAPAGRGTVHAHDAPTLKTLCANYGCGTLLASNPTCCPCTP